MLTWRSMSPARPATSFRAAAVLAGVTPATIRHWKESGALPDGPPWTRAQIRAASRKKRASALSRPRGSDAPHGTPSRWRTGCACAPCRTAHNRDTTQRRREERQTWWDIRADDFIDRIAAGNDYNRTLKELGLTHQAVTGHRKRDPNFAQRLDAALTYIRDPALTHGIATAWKAGCRCPDCRAYHEASR